MVFEFFSYEIFISSYFVFCYFPENFHLFIHLIVIFLNCWSIFITVVLTSLSASLCNLSIGIYSLSFLMQMEISYFFIYQLTLYSIPDSLSIMYESLGLIYMLQSWLFFCFFQQLTYLDSVCMFKPEFCVVVSMSVPSPVLLLPFTFQRSQIAILHSGFIVVFSGRNSGICLLFLAQSWNLPAVF